MKVLTFIVGFLLIATYAFAHTLDGTWKGTWDGGMGGPGELSYTFKVNGNKITGKHFAFDTESPIVEGKVDGNNITFTVKVDFQGMQMTHKYKGVISGDSIKLTWEQEMEGGMDMGDMGGGDMGEMPAMPPNEVTVKRQK